jgi:hypothetical protein
MEYIGRWMPLRTVNCDLLCMMETLRYIRGSSGSHFCFNPDGIFDFMSIKLKLMKP